MANDNNKDIANSLNKLTDYSHKGTDLLLDSAENINKWYEKEVKKIAENDIEKSRLETGVNTENEKNEISEETIKKIETKSKDYNEIQTNVKKDSNLKSNNKIKTTSEEKDLKQITEETNKKIRTSKRIGTVIKGTKFINNSTQKMIRTGKNINTGLNENSIASFKDTSSRIMTKPLKKAGNKISNKITKGTLKYTKKLGKKIGSKFTKQLGQKVLSNATNVLIKMMQLIMKLITAVFKMILSLLPQMAPVLIIIIAIAAFCSFFGIGMSEDTMKEYETYMIETQNEYDATTVEYYNSGKVVDGSIEGKGMINWRAPLSILQMLNGELTYDNAEKELLEEFKKAELFEKITEETYTYEKTTEEKDKDGNVTTKTETVTETKKIVTNPSLDDYINWCNNNFDKINRYKRKKKLDYDKNQTKFTDSEVEQIRLLYNSNSFFDLFSEEFKSTYAYLNVNIGDEQIRAIYEEFLRNAGTRYLMDHSNLSYDTCMDYYDCSSWVIHCLAHTGIIKIPNTGAEGIYRNYCYPITESERKAGDLIFLKNTYGNFPTEGIESITHIGIYMGELTIDGETAEWVIDTGSNPSGVRIRKYHNGWWDGPNFYGFARLKEK